MIEKKVLQTKEDNDILVLSFDLSEFSLQEVFAWTESIKENYKDKYDIILLPKLMDLKYCSKYELWELLDLYKVSVKTIEGVLHE